LVVFDLILIINGNRSFFRFVTIHAFDRQMDGQTDRQRPSSSLVRVGIPCSAENTV